MNERIRELADNIWEEKYWTNPNTDKLLPAQLNRFADMIVRECADIAREWSDDYVVEDTAPKQVDMFIKQHFGVEE